MTNVLASRASRLGTGDVDDDRTVNVADAVLVLKILSRHGAGEVTAGYAESGADADGDGRLGLPEALYILQQAAGLRGN